MAQGEAGLVSSSDRRPVFLISRALGVGGAERKLADVCLHLAESAEQADLRVYVILDQARPADPNEAVLFDSVTASPAIILCKPQQRLGPFGLPFLAYVWWKALTLRPAVILAFLRGPGIVSVLVRRLLWWRDIRVHISNDTLPSLGLRAQVPNRLTRWLLANLMRICYSRADTVLAPSEAAECDLVQNVGVPRQRVIVNPNWVRCCPAVRNTQPLFDLIYVGRVDRVKNLAALARIVHQVREVIPTVRACIVGGGDDMHNVSRVAEQYGLGSTITFTGFLRDVGAYLAASRVFCLTSFYEGLPIAALEAMAHGLPVITTTYPGAEELVEDGVTGHICNGEEEYVERAVQLLTREDLRKEMGEQARMHVWESHGEQNLQEFVTLLR
jgi:glycosyltransferase involved in cell wall biosynthesis